LRVEQEAVAQIRWVLDHPGTAPWGRFAQALAALGLLTAALDRAEQAEKARAEIERRWRERHARADTYDDTGAHAAAQHARAVATGLGEALAILETALKETESASNSGAALASGGETG
jgi:hypothetical protein